MLLAFDWDLGLSEWIRGKFKSLYDTILCAVKQALCQVQQWAFDIAEEQVIDPMLEWLPPPPVWALDFLAKWWTAIDQVVPLSEVMILVPAAITFWVAVTALRFLWRFCGLLLSF